jgi:hypothetical protein
MRAAANGRTDEEREERLRIVRLLEVTETRRASGVAGNAGNRRGCIQLVKRKSLPWCFGTMESDEVHDDSPMGWSERRLLVRGALFLRYA